MSKLHSVAPEHTAARVALWRALHVLIDPEPHVFSDEIGAQLVGEENWRHRPDMNPDFSKSMRASVVGRARFIEDLLEERCGQAELGFEVPRHLHFVPVDFEAGQSWWEKLIAAGFEKDKPAVVVSTGVSMYLTKATNAETLRQIARLAPGSTFAMTFMLSLELLPAPERAIMEFVMEKAKSSGTPFVSLFSPTEMTALAKECGFKDARYISAQDIYQRYFATRPDGLHAGSAEAFLVATT